MRHRIFIAINLPETIKSSLAEYPRKWPELPAKWTKPANMHITLEFLGYVSDQDLVEVLETARAIASRHPSFRLELDRISYAPPGKMPPRMVWATGRKSKELGALKGDLQRSLNQFQVDARPSSPHITLARIRAWDFRKIEPEERPEVEEDISLSFDVDSIEVMKSKLKNGGSEHFVLESCELKHN